MKIAFTLKKNDKLISNSTKRHENEILMKPCFDHNNFLTIKKVEYLSKDQSKERSSYQGINSKLLLSNTKLINEILEIPINDNIKNLSNFS